MYVVRVPGHHYIVPLVVVEWLIGVAFHQRRPVAKVEDVVDIPEREREKQVTPVPNCLLFLIVH